ncbi:miniconductance mechanosensitive channel MscM [Salmonella enterica subsp. enterica serovar Enteritidis]|uniref:miniconductance mechanosensitive channel MscM n=1 Tax=Salmonella enterica TaxID=28901 RepID=UPI000E5AAFE6|nr:miniconductance mechanosensitive channel MscM [Salmonella enterica]EAB5907842.1 miniconductance mechanosensitive channel MscM [Salmonella enterica subsp. enterica serovar Enteritidis]EBG0685239.1 miniconductance mechanosensitive channel MscM [Salmonella enterica subsp. enterica serovar Enteritidis]EBG2925353.1 miniconductance mechanosensitive channel MscM [Salmonella enterica subsp. enterica serovar Enteritidis]EBH2880781.1 miniconductance mechanosensitive channel MscM [Salmonella enterica s
MRLIIAFLMAWCLSTGAFAATAPDAKQITQELEQAKAAKPAQPEAVEALQTALNALEERKGSLERAKQYQHVIDNFPKLSATLRAQLNNLRDEPRSVPPEMSTEALNQEILQVSSQLLDKTREAQQEQERVREIADSLSQLPQQQNDARRQLNEIERRLGAAGGSAALSQAQSLSMQAESAKLKALVDELELAQLSANNRQELARLRSELAEKQSQQLDAYLQALRNQLNSLRQREAERALESTELLAENSAGLPEGIVEQFKVNRELSQALNQQAQRMDLVASQQRQATSQTLQVRQALNTLREQSQWLGVSNMLGEALRAQVARLPEMPKPQQLDTEMAQLRVHRMRYEELLNKQPQLRQIRQANGQPLTAEQNQILDAQLRTQRELLNSLLQGGDTLILELTKLKVSNSQLEDALKEVNEATHRYLFWTADVSPLSLSWPVDLVQDLRRLISLDTFNQLGKASIMMLTSKETLLPLFGALALVTLSLKKAGIPLYLDKEGNGDNMVNSLLWNMLMGAPLIAILAAAVGYLATAQALLARLETSVAIWFLLLVIYHVIRRWMLIQRRRLAFDRAKHRRAEMLAQRARGEEEPAHSSSLEGAVDIDESEIDLDAISAQSLRLVRSILMLIALLSVIVLWSEIHSAFGFLENISLWDVTSTVQGVESLEPITLGAVLIAILVFIITTQLVRNLPALLELALLQHLDLTPGTGYAITTITKYLLMLIGGLVGFSMIGIEWSKLQWLVAALGVGLGFGLQEIFANFISGLIILFEKPIRIGDTVTIRDLTGSVTKINTRATTISDWDRKEIIVPNKAFITEQFINWSLSDSVTRVVLTIPAPADANSEEVTQILLTAAQRCSLVLDNPPPEIFLVDLQQGIQIFELRIYAAEMGHRMPLRHEIHQLILAGFREHGIDMPFPPFQMRLESLGGKQTGRTLTSAGKTSRPAGSL